LQLEVEMVAEVLARVLSRAPSFVQGAVDDVEGSGEQHGVFFS
jgi:hypothetical protein